MSHQQKNPILTRAIHHIRLADANTGKLAELDAVWDAYQPLCEQYIRLFCTEVMPNGALALCFESQLSARWQRDVVRQAAGIAQSWRSNRERHWRDYVDRLIGYGSLNEEQQAKRKKPEWTEPAIPELHAVSI